MGLPAEPSQRIENRGTILLLDDSARNRAARSDELIRRGFKVELAFTLAQAESRWQPDRYILILFAFRKDLHRAADFCKRIKHQNPRQMIGMLVPPNTELPPTRCPDLLWPEDNLDYFLARVETLAHLAPVA